MTQSTKKISPLLVTGLIGFLVVFASTDMSWSQNRLVIDNNLFSIVALRGTRGSAVDLSTKYVAEPATAAQSENDGSITYQTEIDGRDYQVFICSGNCDRVSGPDDVSSMDSSSGVDSSNVPGSAGPYPPLKSGADEEEKRRHAEAKAAYEQEKASLQAKLSGLNSTLSGLSSAASQAQSDLNSAIGMRNTAATDRNRASLEATRWNQKKSDSAEELKKNRAENDGLKSEKQKKGVELLTKTNKKDSLAGSIDSSFVNVEKVPSEVSQRTEKTAAASTRFVQESNSQSREVVDSSHLIKISEAVDRFKVEEQAIGVKEFPGTSGSDVGDNFQTNPLSDNGIAVRQMQQSISHARSTVAGMSDSQRKVADAAIGLAQNAVNVADRAYAGGNQAGGDFALEVGKIALDAGLGLIPGVGLAKDVYEAATGRNLVTGQKLSGFEKTMAFVGILTAGYGSKLALVGKAGVLGDVLKVGKSPAEAADIVKGSSRAAEIVGNAVEAGAKTGDEALEAAKILEPSAGNLWKSSRVNQVTETIDGETVYKAKNALDYDHVFSADHIRGGIMNLGKDRADIAKQMRDNVMRADQLGKLKEGPNQILTRMNGHDATIRAYFKGTELQSLNCFAGNTPREIGNVINLR